MQSVYEYLSPFIPSDHCRQVRATDLVLTELKKYQPKNIVDVGCGTGSSYDFFSRHASNKRWIGVDIDESPEVSQRARDDITFLTFDGVNLPFDDRDVDFVYSNQVLEHVRHPERLLRDIHRVLSNRGVFVGQTSQLEPYHSYSYWNFTVFGFAKICEDAGLALTELRPGIDGITLIERSYNGRPQEYSRWFKEESPLNTQIESNSLKELKRVKLINFRKLMYCGQFVFSIRRSDDLLHGGK